MGLEIVELVITVEERFQTCLTNAEAEKIIRVGDLYTVLMNRIRKQNSHVCISSSIFYSIRRILEQDYNIHRSRIFPDATLTNLLLPQQRVQFWRSLQQNVAGNLPRLTRSHMLQWRGNQFPLAIITLKDLVNKCHERSRITDEFQPEDEALVWSEVCQSVAKQAGVPSEHLSFETEFFRDLGF